MKNKINIIKQPILFFALILFYSCQTDNNSSPNYNASTFVGSTVCQSCHSEQFNGWKDSHHDQAMKIADSTSILADFTNVRFTSNAISSLFFKKGNDYFVNTQGNDGKYHDYKIEYTFGFTPLQQYIVKFPDGKYQCLQTAWDSKKNEWFDLQPNLEIKPNEWIHWTGGGMRWNSACADCHSTNLEKKFDSKSDTYNTTFSEIDVGCEACHGPSSSHVNFYKNNTESKNISPPTMNRSKARSSKELVDQCARCHSRRNQITKVYDYSGTFMDHYEPSLLIDPLYELDGQIRDEVYVYGSFVQSKMYNSGVSCKDCHDVHSMKLKQTGNALCLSCHTPNYDTPSHHFHEANTEATQCVSCHMTGKTYMGNDFRRDHSFRIPRPDQTVTSGTPNACNSCHTEKTPQWASEIIKKNYGDERSEHFSDYLLAGYKGDKEAFYALASQHKFPEIARATALNDYGKQELSPKEFSEIIKFLEDSSALVRTEAIHAFEKVEPTDYSKFIEPLLLDSIRSVRIAAARYFSSRNLTSSKLKKAENELFESFEMNADFSSGQHLMAEFSQQKGTIDVAIEAYKKAIEMDNYNNASRLNLAFLLYQKGDISSAEKLYLEVVELEPNFSFSYYMLGLLYNETGNTDKTLFYLGKAIEKEPVNLRAYYNYALKLQELNQFKESLTIIERALILFPNNEEFLYIKMLAQIKNKEYNNAYQTCSTLISLAPQNTSYNQILSKIKKDMN